MPRTTRAALLSLVVCAPLAFAASMPGAIAQSAGAAAWVGRAAAMEAHLRTAAVVRIEDIGTGVTRPRRAFLDPAVPFASLTWKVIPPGRHGGYWDSYKSEIAAYELDKLLELNMVPPAVERQIDGEVGAAIMWLDSTKSIKQLGGKMPSGPEFGKPIRIMRVFDDLVGNPDRNAGNILIDEARHVILIDHSRAFIDKRDLVWPLERVDEPSWTRLHAVTDVQLTNALSPWLEPRVIHAVLERRKHMETTVADLVARKGAAAVLIP